MCVHWIGESVFTHPNWNNLIIAAVAAAVAVSELFLHPKAQHRALVSPLPLIFFSSFMEEHQHKLSWQYAENEISQSNVNVHDYRIIIFYSMQLKFWPQ